MIKSHDFEELLRKKIKDPAFKKAWEEQEEEFEVAKEIIRLRIEAGITQKELAKRAHTSQPAIARLESGNYKNVSMSFLRRIGKVLGVKPHITFRKTKPRHTARSMPKSQGV